MRAYPPRPPAVTSGPCRSGLAAQPSPELAVEAGDVGEDMGVPAALLVAAQRAEGMGIVRERIEVGARRALAPERVHDPLGLGDRGEEVDRRAVASGAATRQVGRHFGEGCVRAGGVVLPEDEVLAQLRSGDRVWRADRGQHTPEARGAIGRWFSGHAYLLTLIRCVEGRCVTRAGRNISARRAPRLPAPSIVV